MVASPVVVSEDRCAAQADFPLTSYVHPVWSAGAYTSGVSRGPFPRFAPLRLLIKN